MEQPCRAFRGLALFFSRFSQNGFMLPPEPPVAMSPSPERRAAVKARRSWARRSEPLTTSAVSASGKLRRVAEPGDSRPLHGLCRLKCENPESPCHGFALVSPRVKRVKGVRNERGAGLWVWRKKFRHCVN
jgi:hypothetical protein